MRILTRTDVEQAITMPEAIEIVRDAFTQLSNGEATVPLRVPINLPRQNGMTLFMPAYLSAGDALAVKIVSVHNDNPQKGLPLLHALVVALDPATGRPLAVMEGGYLTALRTGAVSGVATDLLARRDAKNAAIFGAGVQGRAQLSAVAAVRELTRVWVYDRRRQSAVQFVEEMRGQVGIPQDIVVAGSPAEAVREADIICTATTSRTPVFDASLVQAGAHINAVGAFTPDTHELPESLFRRADKIVVDSYAGALAEAGDLIIPIQKGILQEANIYAELGELTGGAKAGRERDSEITVFKSVGNAVQDASVAQSIARVAENRGLGISVEL